jgi:hypothetical protein
MPQQNIQPPKQENLWFEGIKTVGLSLFLGYCQLKPNIE